MKWVRGGRGCQENRLGLNVCSASLGSVVAREACVRREIVESVGKTIFESLC
jgi:hypothetical protein